MNDDTRALDIEIAKALGYNVEPCDGSDFVRVIHPQHGRLYNHASSLFRPENIGEVIPKYTTDLNAALSLPLPEGFGVELRKFGEMSFARVVNYLEPEPTVTWDTAPLPALAIAAAWLAWKRGGDGVIIRSAARWSKRREREVKPSSKGSAHCSAESECRQ